MSSCIFHNVVYVVCDGQKKRKDDDCNNVTEILVQASEMEAKRMKKVSGASFSIVAGTWKLTRILHCHR